MTGGAFCLKQAVSAFPVLCQRHHLWGLVAAPEQQMAAYCLLHCKAIKLDMLLAKLAAIALQSRRSILIRE